ncbi:hypothetical protein ADP71_17150 [Vitreoscilla sp. C1]|uniref:hypothetical protein n=1 Tax=Vitreoscilla sp. (strain C1) TaxID=96942 RepID=UPI000CDBC3FB|nr:hypothetical protein [Vitreoscilla sp. C1]AUZ05242.1 hypothetical protein ADP71_17150 [Vitreoscilla sp. C1]
MNYRMKKYFVSLLLLVGCVSLAQAQNIQEGTYVGSRGKVANITSYQHQGINHYELILNQYGFHRFFAPVKDKMIINKPYVFKAEASAHYEDDALSDCRITALWDSEGTLELKGDDKCLMERSLLGAFVYSEKSSLIPSKYIGKWGSTRLCDGDRSAWIRDSSLTNDLDWGSAIVLNTEENPDGSLSVDGVEVYEDSMSASHFNLKLVGNVLYLKGEHHVSNFDDKLVRCINQNND